MTIFVWPWPEATRALIVAYGAGQGGAAGSLGRGGAGGDTTVRSEHGQRVTAAGGDGGLRALGSNQNPGASTAGGNGGDGVEGYQPGRSGDLVLGELTGLAVDDEIVITVGAGGLGEVSILSGTLPPYPTAEDGDPGFALIIPRA